MLQKNRCLAGDLLWGILILLCGAMLLVEDSRHIFLRVTENHAYISGFLKFFVLATMGDLLGLRIINKRWIFPQGFFFKACLWGLIGMAITLLMSVYNEGVLGAMSIKRIPFENSGFAVAFFSSAIMNLTFGPMLYIYHKFGELFIDMKYENKGTRVTLNALVERVDWKSMVCFSWLKTCPLMWIPLHTIVFLLPLQYRVVVSAFLSVFLGALIALSKRKR